MNSLAEQLIAAYAQEEQIYQQIKNLVDEQNNVIETTTDPGAVLALCGQVESLMGEVAVIEQAIEPAKMEWARTKIDPDGSLDRILAHIQTLIEETAAAQQLVQEQLMDMLHRQKQSATKARASVNASKARIAYGSV